jgi:hypothetical protein
MGYWHLLKRHHCFGRWQRICVFLPLSVWLQVADGTKKPKADEPMQAYVFLASPITRYTETSARNFQVSRCSALRRGGSGRCPCDSPSLEEQRIVPGP